MSTVKPKDETISEIKKLLEIEKAKSYNDGLSEGIRCAERIRVFLLVSSHILRNPHSIEANEWSKKEIESLRKLTIKEE